MTVCHAKSWQIKKKTFIWARINFCMQLYSIQTRSIQESQNIHIFCLTNCHEIHLIHIYHDWEGEVFDDKSGQHEQEHHHTQNTHTAPKYFSSPWSTMKYFSQEGDPKKKLKSRDWNLNYLKFYEIWDTLVNMNKNITILRTHTLLQNSLARLDLQ